MKKVIKKLLKWTGVTLLLVIIALILIPIFFKDEIKEMIIDEVNTMLTAELSMEDFDLTFISTFPNMTIELIDTKLTGLNEFEGVELVNIKNLQAEVAFWSVVSGDQIEINAIHMVDPSFNIKVLQNGLANYDVMKPDSVKTEEEVAEPSSFKLSLKEYSITNANIVYDDQAGNMYARIDSLTHIGKGDLTADIIDFETKTNINKLTYRMDEMNYFTDVKTDMVINLLMEFNENSSKFTLRENEIKLNELAFSVDGFYEMLDDYDNMEMTLDASKTSFKNLLSLIPAFYTSGYENMVTSGSLGFNGFVKGKMDDTNLPSWDFGMKIDNASIKYPDLPGKITNIQLDADSKFNGGSNLDLMTVDISKFHANLSKNSVDVTLFMKNLMSDPYIKSSIKSNIDLATMGDFVPLEENESYSGTLKTDINIKGRMSDLDNEDFEKFTAEGTMLLSEMNYASETLPDDIKINEMLFTFSPQNLELNELDAKMGTSDFKMAGKIDNYFGYMLREEKLKGNFSFNSNNLDLDKLMPASETSSGTASTENAREVAPSEEVEPLLIPENLDIVLNTAIDNLKYNGIEIKDVKGEVALNNEIASLNNLNMDAMGGKVGLTGKYNTQNHAKPTMDFSYKLKGVDINQLATNFYTVGKLAPLAKLAQGKITSDLTMSSDLTPGFEPIYSSLISDGFLSSNSISIQGVELLEKIEAVTKLKNLSNQTLKNFKTNFEVKDGKVSLTPFDVKMGNINSEVSGYTTLDQKMDYTFKMDVPKEEIPAEMIKEVETAMSQLNSALPSLNVGKLPATIPVNVKAIGDISNPKITTDFKEAILKATGDFKDDLIENITETVTDTITAIVGEQVDNAKEELEKQKQKILDDAQVQADNIKAEAKKAADATRAEANKQAEALIKEAGSNPIKKKIAQEAAKKTRAEGEKTAKKIESEGEKKADAVMAKARTEADKLG